MKDELSSKVSTPSLVPGSLHPSSFIASSSPRSFLFCAALGAVNVFSFSPFDLFPLPLFTFAALMSLWVRAGHMRKAGFLGFAFGLGYFGAGVSWIYVSLHDFGGMPALVTVLVTALFCAYLALFAAAAGWLALRLAPGGGLTFILAAAASWTLGEWLRGWLFSGFPWLTIGYSQVPTSPLAGFAPLFGVFGVSFVTVLAAGMIQGFISKPERRWSFALGVLLLLAGGFGLGQVVWTTPFGAPLSVSLLQGNIAQEMKFREESLIGQLQTYLDLTKQNPAQLVILPESAVPLLRSQVPEGYLEQLEGMAKARGGDLLLGLFDHDESTGAIYNSVISLGTSATQIYRKHHLVPFGEFIPMKPLVGWVYDTFLHIPLADQARGAHVQEPIKVAGQRVAVDICYEDAFGEEIVRQLPEATLLVNVSNDAWFGERIAPWQHTQIAQTRALETGRYMLRATNTGVTSIIDHRGELLGHLPQLTTAALRGTAQGREGETPYVRLGNAPIVALSLAVIGALAWPRRRSV
jgi:apolipoprotein N-acyltransferase